MLEKRIIPAILISDSKLVKTINFKSPKYIGDPVNTVKIFNDKEVDELLIMDIDASKNQKRPNIELLKSIASEAFMPLCYGGSVSDIDTMEEIYKIGFEKISLCTSVLKDPSLIKRASDNFGSQSVICSINVDKSFFLKKRIVHGASSSDYDPFLLAQKFQDLGAGEILFNFIYNDGKCLGFDNEFISRASKLLSIPIIALGGAWTDNHLVDGLKAGANAVAAGSKFIYYGPHKAVLINYPSRKTVQKILNEAKDEQ